MVPDPVAGCLPASLPPSYPRALRPSRPRVLAPLPLLPLTLPLALTLIASLTLGRDQRPRWSATVCPASPLPTGQLINRSTCVFIVPSSPPALASSLFCLPCQPANRSTNQLSRPHLRHNPLWIGGRFPALVLSALHLPLHHARSHRRRHHRVRPRIQPE